jgi:NAD(P)-dependent dehydrogenase (short-subunit alcohol dehydrogenase family)
LQFGTNHLGHFAWTGLLLERLLPVPASRVVTLSSNGHKLGRIHFDDLQWRRSYRKIPAYGQSKLANLLFTYELQRRLAGARTIAVAAHPGLAATELERHMPSGLRLLGAPIPRQSAQMGSLPTLRAATDPHVNGAEYYGPDGFAEFAGHPVLVKSNARAHDEVVARRLWKISEELTDVHYPITDPPAERSH